MRYTVHFKHPLLGNNVLTFQFDGSIADVIRGFWINEDNAYTKLSDAKYWIPAHKIEFIETNPPSDRSSDVGATPGGSSDAN